MPAKILVLVKKDGLNHNLLRLALDSGQFDLHFLELSDVDSRALERADCLIVDDSVFASLEELNQGLSPHARQKKIIYLSKHIPQEAKSEVYPALSCVLKPFNPGELKAMLAC